MSKTIHSVRVHYTYYDDFEGTLQGSIDLFTEGNKFVSDGAAKHAIIEKWQKSKYTGAIYDSINIIDFEY